MSVFNLYIRLLLILITVIFVTVGINAQTRTDVDLLKSADFNRSDFNNKQVNFGISGNKSLIAKYNPITLVFSSFLYIYQKVISPQLSVDCLFYPTCSEYSRKLFIQYGLPGVFFTADRLMRCHRISATSFNPVSINETDMKVHEDVRLYSFNKYFLKKSK